MDEEARRVGKLAGPVWGEAYAIARADCVESSAGLAWRSGSLNLDSAWTTFSGLGQPKHEHPVLHLCGDRPSIDSFGDPERPVVATASVF